MSTAAIIEDKIGQLCDPVEALGFMVAGNATVTLRSLATGKRYTYKIKRPEDFKPANPIWFVSLLTGGDNDNSFSYLGMIRYNAGRDKFYYIHGAKSSIGRDYESNKGFDYVFTTLVESETIPPRIEIWHAGRCCVCGRKLTVPSSVEAGIGPDCAGKEGI